MDFVFALPRPQKGRNSILIMVDRFFKMMHFIACHKIDHASYIIDLFTREIVCLHGISRSIVSNHDVKFLSYLLKTLWEN
jgi:hypothetical protein